ncbi:MAG TPA: hypothetical protein VK071_10480 [Tissierellales bacterium]|nr:hypothetical protein [Tissierellales bacterium]
MVKEKVAKEMRKLGTEIGRLSWAQYSEGSCNIEVSKSCWIRY